ncbi:GNAT family N-acetyltransferase [Homoserinibacter sp. YIM 151385]|uniref:GNAT family N-acetyltransferase n=1 Tax=Homoserinibacter sp. YIM 151385 TaxID=2985506 RepID=UPI0022EFF622|nr:GNAT family N-acetyltransferase [Homoserinibacter sp. YIM 151385]WBU36896.1 GNAT family N-acetyltransferase [Homoserinibacter sp. YIM 151385]
MSGARIRGLREGDLPALRAICLATTLGPRPTGAAEGMLPDVYLEPYVRRHPDWAWIAAGADDEPLGYLVAAPDSAAFAAWWRESWSPVFRERHGDDGSELARHGLLGDDLEPPGTEGFPAHLHIDLLPELQGQGVGPQLMARLLAALAEAGIPGVHLGVAPENHGAKRWYARQGFRPVGGDENLLARRIGDR